MKRALILIALVSIAGCSHKPQSAPPAKANGFGAAVIESSGGKQIAPAGMLLQQPVVVQVSDQQENGVTVQGRIQRACRCSV